MTDPIDQLHHDCLMLQLQIRNRYREAQERARRWHPSTGAPPPTEDDDPC